LVNILHESAIFIIRIEL